MRWQKAVLLFPLLSAILISVAASIPSRKTHPAGDLLDYYIPLADWTSQRLIAQDSSCWNPEVGCGLDRLGPIHTSLCYPLTWIHAALGVRDALTLLGFLHLAIAGMGMFCWLRSLGVGSIPAILAATALEFGLVGEWWWPPLLYAVSWTPWVLYTIDSVHLSATTRWLVAVVVLSLQILAGFPQYMFYSLLFVGAYLVLKCIADRSLRMLCHAASAALLALTISSVQLVPSYYYLQETWRPSRLAPEEVHYLDVGKRLDDNSLYRDACDLALQSLNCAGYRTTSSPHSLSLRDTFGYLGVFVPFVAFFAFADRRQWRIWFFAIAALAGFYLSRGHAGLVPAYAILAKVVPLFGSFRTPDRLLVWTLFAVTALMGLGGQRLWPDRQPRAVSRTQLAIAAFAYLGLMALSFLFYFEVRAFTYTSALFLLGIAPLFVGSSLLARGRLARLLPVGAVCVASLADLWLAAGYVCRFREYPSAFFTSIHGEKGRLLRAEELGALAQRAGKERIYIAEAYQPVMRTSALPAFRTLPLYEPLSPARHFVMSSRLMFPQEKPRFSKFLYYAIPAVPHLRWFDWCSVRFLVTREALADAARHGWKEVESPSGAVHVYENSRCVPRAALCESPLQATPEEALQWMCSPGASAEFDAPRIEAPPSPQWLEEQARHRPAAGPLGSVEWVVDEPSHLALKVRCHRPAFLLLSDSWLSGWRCTVDGDPRPILRANFLHRAVELLPGEHSVEFSYRTFGLQAGLWLSACGLSVLLAAAGVCAWKAKRSC